jgi:phage tail sheath gpL-like
MELFNGWSFLNSGQQVSIRCDTTVVVSNLTAASTHWLYICRESGPSAIAATETVAMSAYLSANTSFASGASIKYDVKEFDSHGAYSTTTGVWTSYKWDIFYRWAFWSSDAL